jgi:tRNA (guanosine-2'-O-)-methyltransferase
MTPERFQKLQSVLQRRQPDLTVLAADVHKTHNIAAILRTCDAVGVYRMHAVSTEGEFRRHHMVSGGSKRWVDTKIHSRMDEALQYLREDNWRVVAAHPGADSRDYREVDYTTKLAVVLGSELDGLAAETISAVDETICVPVEGMVASLNVSVAAALILYEAQRQRRAAGLYERSRLSRENYDTTLFEWSYPDIATRCRQKGQPYPPLTEEGQMATNPLAAPL